MTTSEAVAAFLLYCRVRKNRPQSTVYTYERNLADFVAYLENKPIEDLTFEDIDAYADALALRVYKPKTYRNKLCTVRSFINFLYNKNLTDIRPGQIELPTITEEDANFLDEDEVERFMGVVKDVRDRAMLLVLLTSGIRVTEFLNIRYSDMHHRSIVIRRGKGGKPRPVFITPEARKAVDKYIRLKRGNNPDGPLFPNPLGGTLSRVVVARKVHYYALKAGIKKHCTPHTLRHTFATTLLRNGARVEDAQKILGHSNIRTTLIYLHFTDDYIAKRYDQFML